MLLQQNLSVEGSYNIFNYSTEFTIIIGLKKIQEYNYNPQNIKWAITMWIANW